MDDFERALNEYDYDFPAAAVALEPAEPRDAARLLVYDPDSGTASFSAYRHLAEHLPPRSCLVLNETKVIPARVEAVKRNGGKVRVLYLRSEGDGTFAALADRKLAPGSAISAADAEIRVESVSDGEYRLKFADGRSPLEFFVRHGRMPLPPYLRGTALDESELKERYQTVFARRIGSVAAPTASLHFTPELLRDLAEAGHDIAFVTLHVNIGTFLPLKPQQFAAGELHAEEYEISADAAAKIEAARREGRPVIAVGTTVTRALESAARGGELASGGQTRLFIRPGFEFRVVDGLITNFHVPKSSLMMLVAALVGRERLLDLYRRAIAAGFRLFSFGDGMLILPHTVGKHDKINRLPS